MRLKEFAGWVVWMMGHLIPSRIAKVTIKPSITRGYILTVAWSASLRLPDVEIVLCEAA